MVLKVHTTWQHIRKKDKDNDEENDRTSFGYQINTCSTCTLKIQQNDMATNGCFEHDLISRPTNIMWAFWLGLLEGLTKSELCDGVKVDLILDFWRRASAQG